MKRVENYRLREILEETTASIWSDWVIAHLLTSVRRLADAQHQLRDKDRCPPLLPIIVYSPGHQFRLTECQGRAADTFKRAEHDKKRTLNDWLQTRVECTPNEQFGIKQDNINKAYCFPINNTLYQLVIRANVLSLPTWTLASLPYSGEPQIAVLKAYKVLHWGTFCKYICLKGDFISVFI